MIECFTVSAQDAARYTVLSLMTRHSLCTTTGLSVFVWLISALIATTLRYDGSSVFLYLGSNMSNLNACAVTDTAESNRQNTSLVFERCWVECVFEPSALWKMFGIYIRCLAIYSDCSCNSNVPAVAWVESDVDVVTGPTCASFKKVRFWSGNPPQAFSIRSHISCYLEWIFI